MRDRRFCAVDHESYRAQYDAVAGSAGRMRRKPNVETSGETGDGGQLPATKRLRLCNLCRDIVRNFSVARSLVRQICNTVVGADYKLRIRQEDVAARKAEEWYNKVFARNCDFRSDRHISDIYAHILTAMYTDGDVGIAFDRDLLATGRIILYESDQICTPSSLPETVGGFRVASCSDGVMLDEYGREIGYFVSRNHGCPRDALENGHVWRRDPSGDVRDEQFRVVRRPWRIDQRRGIPEMAAAVADLIDCYEMRSKELQTAKVAATFALAVRKSGPDAGTVLATPAYNPLTPDAEGAEADAMDGGRRYENLEAISGGAMEYLEDGESIDVIDPKSRPNMNVEEFTRRVVKHAGASLGFAQCYALLEANSSYTAYRGEMIMTWATVRVLQKWFERNVQDWIAVNAIRFAAARGIVQGLGKGWEDRLSWSHPEMPQVDPLKDSQAKAYRMANYLTSLQKELGPDWRDNIEAFREVLDACEKARVHAPGADPATVGQEGGDDE